MKRGILFSISLIMIMILTGCDLINTNEDTSLKQQISGLQEQISGLSYQIQNIQSEKEQQNDIKTKTVRINSYSSVNCSKNCEPCNKDMIIALEVDSSGTINDSTINGSFYIRGYLDNKKIGEVQITQNDNPFNGDGGKKIIADKDAILTLNTPFPSNFLLKSTDSSDYGTYILTIKNTPELSSFNNKLLDLCYEENNIQIGFPQ